MSTHLEKTFDVAVTPEKASAAMRNPALIEESERSRDAKSVRVEEHDRTDTRHEFTIHTETPARTIKGVDPNKTERNTTRVTWDLSALRGTWVWKGEHKQVSIAGGYDLTPAGDGGKIRMYVDIDVGIPVAGRMVEKKIREGFEDNWPDYIRRVERFAKAE